MLVTPEYLQQKVLEKRITRWISEECPVCDYAIHYAFSGMNMEQVQHDCGCTCTDQEVMRVRYMNSSYKEMSEYINGVTDQDKLKEIKQFWNL